MLRLAAFLSFALVLPALAETGEYDFDPIKIRAGKEAFAQACARCHQPDAKGESYGPPLDNIAGRQAGTFMDYPYSEALSEAGSSGPTSCCAPGWPTTPASCPAPRCAMPELPIQLFRTCFWPISTRSRWGNERNTRSDAGR